jgi:hypothetical protein
MKSCPNPVCRKLIPQDARHCPYCGHALPKRSNMPLFVVLALVVLGLAVALILNRNTIQAIFSKTPVVQAPQAALTIPTGTKTRGPEQQVTQVRATLTASPAATKTLVPATSTPVATLTGEATAAKDLCKNAPAPRVYIDALVSVVTTDHDRLVLRSSAEINDSNELERLHIGTQLKIHDGPVCVVDPKTHTPYWFWEVKVKSSARMGWVAEGDRALYYLKVVR